MIAPKTVLVFVCLCLLWCLLPLHQYGKTFALRYGSHSFACKLHRTCLYLVSIHQMTPPHADWGCGHLIAAYSYIYPERMKGWVGLVGWPTADGLSTNTGGQIALWRLTDRLQVTLTRHKQQASSERTVGRFDQTIQLSWNKLVTTLNTIWSGLCSFTLA